jgi:hypothetical protein
MRTAGLWLLLAALPACAQIVKRPAAAQIAERPAVAAVASINQAHFSLNVITYLEAYFDGKLQAAGPERMRMMGETRGVYLPGYGLVFTAEVDLAVTPIAGGIVRHEITPAEIVTFHQKKLEQLVVVSRLMREMLTVSAQKADLLPDNERIVVAVRLMYQSWEDQTHLPRQILMTADRKSAIAGQIREELTQ